MTKIIYRQKGLDPYYKVWHTPNVNTIILMYSEGGSIVSNEEKLPIKKGSLCFIGSAKYHYTMPDNIENYERTKLFLLNEELSSIIQFFPEPEELKKKFSSEAIVYSEINNEDLEIIDKIISDAIMRKDTKNFKSIFLSTCLRILAYIDENQTKRVSPLSQSFSAAINYINEHISENIKIDDICTTAHISKYHFCREFKKITGQTLMEYILRTRMMLAEDMLAKGDESIKTISEVCGFSSFSYFSRTFKKEYGITPSDFRRYAKKSNI